MLYKVYYLNLVLQFDNVIGYLHDGLKYANT